MHCCRLSRGASGLRRPAGPLWVFFRRQGIVALLAVFLLVGCQAEAEDARFAATIVPLRAVVEPVTGDSVFVLIPPAASPHTHEPRPSDARRAANAEIVFYGSEALDGWGAALGGRRRVALVDLLPDSARRPAYGGADTDPHFWLDPLTVRALVPVLADTLCAYDPGRCRTYRERAHAFAEELLLVHDSLSVLMAPAAGSAVIVSHPFLHYFAARYDLRVVGAVEEVAGGEPTPRDLQRLLRVARSSSVRVVFTQPQHSSRTALAVGEAAGVPVVELDPIGAADNLPDLLYLNAQRIRSALVDRPDGP